MSNTSHLGPLSRSSKGVATAEIKPLPDLRFFVKDSSYPGGSPGLYLAIDDSTSLLVCTITQTGQYSGAECGRMLSQQLEEYYYFLDSFDFDESEDEDEDEEKEAK